MEGFSSYWQRKAKTTPDLCQAKNKMTMSVESFRKQLESAYRAGAGDKAEVMRKLEQVSGKNTLADDIFKKMFGKDLF